MSRFRLTVCAVIVLLILVLPLGAAAQDITGLIKIFGIGYVVDRYSEPLNNFVNTLLSNRGVAVREKTKVVPILSIGVGQASYIGAATLRAARRNCEVIP